jgi:hypothetical protein
MVCPGGRIVLASIIAAERTGCNRLCAREKTRCAGPPPPAIQKWGDFFPEKLAARRLRAGSAQGIVYKRAQASDVALAAKNAQRSHLILLTSARRDPSAQFQSPRRTSNTTSTPVI